MGMQKICNICKKEYLYYTYYVDGECKKVYYDLNVDTIANKKSKVLELKKQKKIISELINGLIKLEV
jgi:hypothetical protein